MSPVQYLLLMLAITVLACVIEGTAVYRRRQALWALARRHEMNFSAVDRFRLTQRVYGQLPVFGAARIRVSDLVFTSNSTHHRYVFTIEYTVGAVFGHHRHRCIGGFEEAVRRGGQLPDGAMLFSKSGDSSPVTYGQILEQMKSSRAGLP